MQFTCDRCHGDYDATATNAAAYLFLKDSRSNHIEAHCSHCGNKEVIFLGPRQITAIIRDEGVPPTVEAEAGARLRVRAEKAWAAAEEKDLAEQHESATPAPPTVHTVPASGDVLERYELTQRHEDLLGTFGKTLTNIPDELLWDELRSDHDRKHPDRWID
jgi:hypothetical protein